MVDFFGHTPWTLREYGNKVTYSSCAQAREAVNVMENKFKWTVLKPKDSSANAIINPVMIGDTPHSIISDNVGLYVDVFFEHDCGLNDYGRARIPSSIVTDDPTTVEDPFEEFYGMQISTCLETGCAPIPV
jgi:hypothetical protein